MADRIILPRALDSNGDIVAGARAYFYDTGTTNQQTVYSDAAGTVPVSQPLTADAAGAFAATFATSVVKVDVVDDEGTSLPGYPSDPHPKVPATGTGASNISFGPSTENPSTNVQDAIDRLLEQPDFSSVTNRATILTDLGMLDQDDMASDSATHFATQQSIKAYADGKTDFIASAEASSDATIEFTGFDSAKYDSYELEFINVVPATDDVNLQIRTSGDGGSTYDSGASDYAYTSGQSGSGNANSSNGTTAILPTNTGSNNVGSASGEEGVSGTLFIHGPHVAARTMITGALGYRNSVGSLIAATTVGMRKSTADVDAVQISFHSGNIESGTIILRGKRNS